MKLRNEACRNSHCSDCTVKNVIDRQAEITFLVLGSDPNQAPKVLNSRDGVQRAGDDLAGARALCFLSQARLEQLSVGQDDSELVVQAVKDPRELGSCPFDPLARLTSTGLRRHG